MADLEFLHLSYNQLKEIPPEIGNLKSLKLLALNNNQLTIIPKEIGKLTNLKKLFISDNKLTKEDIDKIKKLLPNCEVDPVEE